MISELDAATAQSISILAVAACIVVVVKVKDILNRVSIAGKGKTNQRG
jgi:hypothetical protein